MARIGYIGKEMKHLIIYSVKAIKKHIRDTNRSINELSEEFLLVIGYHMKIVSYLTYRICINENLF